MTTASHNLPIGLLWAAGLLLTINESASAARLLDVYIEQDGNLVAHTYYSSGDREDAATVWRYLGNEPAMVDDDVTNLEGDPADALVQMLDGNVVVRFQHTDRVLAQVQLTTLTLQRTDPQMQRWFLPESEVERTAALAGLGPPSTPPPDPMVIGTLVVSALVVLVFLLLLVGLVVIVFLLWRRSGAAARDCG